METQGKERQDKGNGSVLLIFFYLVFMSDQVCKCKKIATSGFESRIDSIDENYFLEKNIEVVLAINVSATCRLRGLRLTNSIICYRYAVPPGLESQD